MILLQASDDCHCDLCGDVLERCLVPVQTALAKNRCVLVVCWGGRIAPRPSPSASSRFFGGLRLTEAAAARSACRGRVHLQRDLSTAAGSAGLLAARGGLICGRAEVCTCSACMRKHQRMTGGVALEVLQCTKKRLSPAHGPHQRRACVCLGLAGPQFGSHGPLSCGRGGPQDDCGHCSTMAQARLARSAGERGGRAVVNRRGLVPCFSAG
jgi:hypothetical protein